MKEMECNNCQLIVEVNIADHICPCCGLQV